MLNGLAASLIVFAFSITASAVESAYKLVGTWEWDQGRGGTATLAIESIGASGGLRGRYVYVDGRGREYPYVLRDDGSTDPGVAVGNVTVVDGALSVKITLYPETSTFDLTVKGNILSGPFHFVPRNRTFPATFQRKQ